jgi:hypothetical protein
MADGFPERLPTKVPEESPEVDETDDIEFSSFMLALEMALKVMEDFLSPAEAFDVCLACD